MSKFTAWFPGQIKPVRVGVYQQKNGFFEIGYQRWDGLSWFYWFETPEMAARSDCLASSMFQNDPWRGLASKPKGSK